MDLASTNRVISRFRLLTGSGLVRRVGFHQHRGTLILFNRTINYYRTIFWSSRFSDSTGIVPFFVFRALPVAPDLFSQFHPNTILFCQDTSPGVGNGGANDNCSATKIPRWSCPSGLLGIPFNFPDSSRVAIPTKKSHNWPPWQSLTIFNSYRCGYRYEFPWFLSILSLRHPYCYTTGHWPWESLAIFFYFCTTRIRIRRSVVHINPVLTRSHP